MRISSNNFFFSLFLYICIAVFFLCVCVSENPVFSRNLRLPVRLCKACFNGPYTHVHTHTHTHVHTHTLPTHIHTQRRPLKELYNIFYFREGQYIESYFQVIPNNSRSFPVHSQIFQVIPGHSRKGRRRT